MSNLKFVVLMLVLFSAGCGQIGRSAEEKSAYATWQAEQYPWAFYPISEDSKIALCQALSLPADDNFCQEGQDVWHEDVFEIVKELFPVNQTSYDEVEAKLGNFPHSIEESRQPDGTLVSLGYVYRLTNYKGACIIFFVNPSDKKTLEKIIATGIGSAPGPTTCGPSE